MTISSDIQNVVDAMLPPPSSDPADARVQEYLERVQRAMVFLSFAVMGIQGNDLDKAIYYRNAVSQRLRDVSDMHRRAAGAGLFVQANPVPYLSSLNGGRAVLQPIAPNSPAYPLAVESLSTLCGMLNDEKSGALDITAVNRPQLGSLSISFSGIRGIPSNIVNADTLKRQQALDSLRLLDFSKRRCRVLFVAESDADTLDMIVGMRRMGDAAGYVVTLSEKVTGDRTQLDISAADRDEVAWAFYRSMLAPILGPSVAEKDLVLARAVGVRRNGAYFVSVRPYQRTGDSQPSLFRTPLNRLTLTDSQLGSIESLIAAFGATTVDDVTPYPFISEMLYGDRRYGWMLAGLNLLSSYERGDTPARVRGYSYIAARMSDIRQRITAGEFYVPADRGAFVDLLDRCFSSQGLSGTLAEVLEKCGMLMFFDEREGFDVTDGSLNRESAVQETSMLSSILTIVDPATATVLPSRVRDRIRELTAAQGPLQLLLVSFPSVARTPPLDSSDELIDLISFDGMSRLMDLIVDTSRGAR